MSNAQKKLVAAATAANNLAVIGWDGPLLPGCLGYEVLREDRSGQTRALGNYMRFEGDNNAEWKSAPTSLVPWQGFKMRDLTSKLGSEFRYRVSPVFGSPESPRVEQSQQAITNWVALTTACGPHMEFACNNGFLSSQFIARQLPKGADGLPDGEVLRTRLQDEKDPLWRMLTAGLDELILSAFDRARDCNGSVLAMLYELSSGRALRKMEDNADILELLLGNSGKDDEGNAPGRARMKSVGVKVHDMMVPASSIFHLKVWLVRNALKQAISVCVGSTNVTDNGFSVQANNALWLHSPEVAELFQEFAAQLLADNNQLGSALRQWCATPRQSIVLPDGSVVDVFFSPCTPTAEKPPQGQWSPPLKFLWDLLQGAQESFHFNFFMPGTPSAIDMVREIRKAKPHLILEGTVNTKQSLGAKENFTLLFHHEDTEPTIVPASAFEGGNDGDWNPELFLLPGAHAAVHSKCGVVDAGTDNPTTFTMSHNAGEKASAFNVENSVFVRGNRSLAGRMFSHCTDVREHYLSRYLLQDTYARTDLRQSLTRDDAWQKRYAVGGQRAKKNTWLVRALANMSR